MKRYMENCLWIILIFTLILVDVEPLEIIDDIYELMSFFVEAPGVTKNEIVVENFQKLDLGTLARDEMDVNFMLAQTRQNHFPEFKNCSSYKPRIKEEQPVGTPVITVVATDPDPPGEGGTIQYQLITDSSKKRFSINPFTGQITTNVKFDRDEPARQQEEKIIVRATDDGRQQLEAICLFTVIIEDINDNAPVFEKSSYKESIPMDEEINSQLLRIMATDIDDGLNREVEYALSGSGEDYDFFTIDKTSGIVKLMKEITQPVGHVFKIQVSATDKNPTEPKSSVAQLEITVIEANRKAPKLDDPLPGPVIELLENFTSTQENIATLKVKLNPEEHPPVFTLLTGKREDTNSRDTFVLTTNDEKNTAFIRWSGNVRLDYEVVKEYTLTVRVENMFLLATEYSFKIKLLDVNDNAPKFEKRANFGQVLENEPPGTVVMTVQATDADETLAFKEITYELQDFTDVFELDSKTGVMTTKRELDRETNESYTIKVIAKDGAPSAILNNGESNTGEQVFRIDVADKNDNSPRFEKDKFIVELPENAEVNTVVIEVEATDPDTASQIDYSIVGGNEDDTFTIDLTTGVIKTKAKLDFEKKASYVLEVKATDGLLHASCTVEVKVLDVNERTNKKKPRFWWRCREVSIAEKKLIPGCIAKVKAFDPDLKRNEDQKIVYSVLHPSLNDSFKIDANGCLSLLKPLERRSQNVKQSKQYKVLIKASDEGGNAATSKSSVGVVFVNVAHRCWLAQQKRWHRACYKFKPCSDRTFDCLLSMNMKIPKRSQTYSRNPILGRG